MSKSLIFVDMLTNKTVRKVAQSTSDDNKAPPCHLVSRELAVRAVALLSAVQSTVQLKPEATDTK